MLECFEKNCIDKVQIEFKYSSFLPYSGAESKGLKGNIRTQVIVFVCERIGIQFIHARLNSRYR